jgi:Zn-dependent protease with chaperone function
MVSKKFKHISNYRYPNERLIFFFTILLVIIVVAVTATATVCMSVIFVIGMLVFAYLNNRAIHNSLINSALRVSHTNTPDLMEVIESCSIKFGIEPPEVYIAPSKVINAYTFGITSPKVIVLNSALLEIVDRDELTFIIGHEMGHIQLGHTWLNTIVGGLAGIPSPYAAFALLYLVFRWWNRSCEYSADRAGLLASGKLRKSVTALVKIHEKADFKSRNEMLRAFQRLETEDEDFLWNLSEVLASHPMGVNRVNKLVDYYKLIV